MYVRTVELLSGNIKKVKEVKENSVERFHFKPQVMQKC